ncbi:MAG: phosphomannomutase/phosphoglucomutase [Candidatus Paceibacterota bacterium]
MVNIDSEIFKAYDIRGTYPDQINPEIFYLFGRAYFEFLDGDEVVIGRDARPSSFELFKALAAGIEEQGGQVINIGEATTPLLYFATGYFEASGGLMITASHNPAGYNGLKVTGENGIPVSGETGFDEIQELINNSDWEVKSLQEKMSQIQPDTREVKQEYLRRLVTEINLNQKIAIDCGNGMAGILVEPLLNELGIDYEMLYSEPDCTFPNHEANPLKEETLKDLKQLMKKEDIEIGVAFDGDADRVGFVDKDLGVIGGDYITALLAEEQLKDKKGPVVYDLRSSKIVPEVISNNGGEPVKTRVGHSFIKQIMREKEAIFAGELSSHYFYPFEIKNRVTYFESPLLAVIQLLKKISGQETLKDLIRPLKKYYQSGEINFEVDNKKQIMDDLVEHYEEEAQQVLHLDGISIEFDDWWFNVRPSNTEPVLRLNLEADNEQLMKEKTKEVRSLVVDN